MYTAPDGTTYNHRTLIQTDKLFIELSKGVKPEATARVVVKGLGCVAYLTEQDLKEMVAAIDQSIG